MDIHADSTSLDAQIAALDAKLAATSPPLAATLRKLIAAAYETIDAHRRQNVSFNDITTRFNDVFSHSLSEPITVQRLRQLFYAERAHRKKQDRPQPIVTDAALNGDVGDQRERGEHHV